MIQREISGINVYKSTINIDEDQKCTKDDNVQEICIVYYEVLTDWVSEEQVDSVLIHAPSTSVSDCACIGYAQKTLVNQLL